MRHRMKGRKLGRSASHRNALMAGLAGQLFMEDRITTTLAKAKALRPYAEKLITRAKKGDLHSRRIVLKKLLKQKKLKFRKNLSKPANRKNLPKLANRKSLPKPANRKSLPKPANRKSLPRISRKNPAKQQKQKKMRLRINRWKPNKSKKTRLRINLKKLLQKKLLQMKQLKKKPLKKNPLRKK